MVELELSIISLLINEISGFKQNILVQNQDYKNPYSEKKWIEEYAKRLMTDAQIMDALTGDIYGIGRVIATNKFKYLRFSYMSFLTGLTGAIVIFTAQLLLT